MEKRELRALLVGMQTPEATVEFTQRFLNKTDFDPVILLLGTYPKNPETPIRKNMCTLMFIAAVFTVVKIWK